MEFLPKREEKAKKETVKVTEDKLPPSQFSPNFKFKKSSDKFLMERSFLFL